MKSSILLFVTLTVCFRLVFSLDCLNAPGISFIPCQNPSASSTGGSGGTGGASSQDNTIVVQPCADIQYNGGTPQKYTVTNQAVPQVFELLFETLNIPDGEKLLIKTFKCNPNNDCKIAVIDSTAATPLSVNINKYSFALSSRSSSVTATFKVNYDCTPVNGGWSNWGPYSSCNENCKQERIRSCDNPPPSNGGQPCGGSPIQIQDCTGGLCVPVNGGWSGWGPWRPCSEYCTKERTRYCNNPRPENGGANCIGNDKQFEDCSEAPCVHGGWSDWEPYTTCNAQCLRQRTRSCNNPTPSAGGSLCEGQSLQIEGCTGGFCPSAGSGCDDFTTQVGSKMLKQQSEEMTFQDCFDVCETTYSQMLKVTSMEDSNATGSYFTEVWLGVKQTGPNTYKWNDDTTFTVTLQSGKIEEYVSMTPWVSYFGHIITTMWDRDTYDSVDCLSVNKFGWKEVTCNSQKVCACECTIP